MSCLHPAFQLAAQTSNMHQLEGTPGLEVACISACLSPDQMSLSLSATQQTGWWANTMPACQGAECPEGYHTMLCKSTSELAEELKDLRSVNRFFELLYLRERVEECLYCRRLLIIVYTHCLEECLSWGILNWTWRVVFSPILMCPSLYGRSGWAL